MGPLGGDRNGGYMKESKKRKEKVRECRQKIPAKEVGEREREEC